MKLWTVKVGWSVFNQKYSARGTPQVGSDSVMIDAELELVNCACREEPLVFSDDASSA